MNSVKLFSNGSAVITKVLELVENPLKVSIPVKKEDLDEVVSSLTVYGDVTMPEPPNYTPVNSNQTTLNIDSENVVRNLFTALRGAEVEITYTGGDAALFKGKVLGIQVSQQEVDGNIVEKFKVVVGNKNGIQSIDEANIRNIKFVDEIIQSEINKALAASLSSIKDDGRTVDFTVVPNEGATSAAVSYATPCAAYKIRYQVRLLAGVASIECQAIVDNDTDDDWKDVSLSVINGDPISFSTDIAQIRRPKRSHVNVVSTETTGAVNVEDSYEEYGESQLGGLESMAYAASAAPNMRSMAAKSVRGVGGSRGPTGAPGPVATFKNAEVKESGDFSVYTAPNPVTILSRKSAIIGLFDLPLEEFKTVLYYNPSDNATRPFTAVKFKNSTQNSLNKGSCEIYVDGDRQGKCILQNTQKGEESFLVYALENGVKVFTKKGEVENRTVGLKFSQGNVFSENSRQQETSYVIKNNKGENFQFEIEHTYSLTGTSRNAAPSVSTDKGEATVVNTANGVRVTVTLPANETLTVRVKEITVDEATYSNNYRWIRDNIFSLNHSLSKNGDLKKLMEIQERLETAKNEVNTHTEKLNFSKEDQTRVCNLLSTKNFSGVIADGYTADVATMETEIRNLTKQIIPEAKARYAAIEKEFTTALAKLSVTWEDRTPNLNQQDDVK